MHSCWIMVESMSAIRMRLRRLWIETTAASMGKRRMSTMNSERRSKSWNFRGLARGQPVRLSGAEIAQQAKHFRADCASSRGLL